MLPALPVRPGLPVTVMSRLALSEAQVTASEALELGKCNAGSVDVVVFAFDSLSSIEIDLEMGNDRENWSHVLAAVFRRGGFGRLRFRGVASRYIRLHYRAAGNPGGIGILTTTVNGSDK